LIDVDKKKELFSTDTVTRILSIIYSFALNGQYLTTAYGFAYNWHELSLDSLEKRKICV